MSFRCLDCGKICSGFNKYVWHNTYIHNKMNYFLCPVSNCKRLYYRKYDLKKHIARHELIQESTSVSKKVSQNKKNLNSLSEENVNENNILNKTSNQNEEESFYIRIQQNLQAFKDVFNISLQSFVSKLYDDLTLTRAAVQSIIHAVEIFLSSGLIKIIKETVTILCENVELNSSLDPLNTMLNLLEYPFESLNTEYKRVQYFEKCEKLIKPVEYNLGVLQEQKRNKNGEVILNLKNSFSYYIPMNKILKSFLEIPEVFRTIIDYQEKFLCDQNYGKNGLMSNIIHGSLWKNRKNVCDKKHILPIILYFDDFETGNPLGSHAGFYKMGAVYFTIATIPPEYGTRLENIFLAYIFHSTDRVHYGNEITFNIIINQLNQLENEGIFIETEQGTHNIFFSLAAIIGDNLGIHSIFGLHENFSSNYYCRFCTAPKAEMTNQISEKEQYIRLKNDYEGHVSNQIGIKEFCIWHKLNNFHLYENLTCDIMHDLYEGMFRYDMALIISALISKNFFNLDNLNSRLKYYTYENFEKNIPPDIKKEHLNNGSIISSAAEMLCLVKNFRILIGDLVPVNNRIWEFYLILLDLVEILTSSTISKSTLDLLKTLVEEHHSLYTELFKIGLKPKHHFLVHYVRVIEKIGPPVLISCMRFEGKHKDLKSFSHNIRSRKNLPYSLAFRAQLKCCYRFLAERGFNDNINFGSLSKIQNIESVLFENNNLDPNQYCSTLYYEVNGIRYSCNSVVLYDYLDDETPCFGQIRHIFINKVNYKVVYFICKILCVTEYSIHFKAYKVVSQEKQSFVKFDELQSNVPTIIHCVPENQQYISV